MKRLLAVWLLLLVAAWAQDNDNWSSKVVLIPMGTGSAARPPDVPPDPKPGTVYADGKVFQDPQLYVAFVMGPQGVDWSHNSTRWYFLPSGRTYVRICDQSANVNQFWGKYKIDDEGNVSVLTDSGESLSMQMKHRRRELIWSESVYVNIKWENEILQPGAD